MNRPTLVNGLLGLSALQRESTAELRLVRDPQPRVNIHLHGHDQPVVGDLDPSVPLTDQLTVLAASGLVGGLTLTEDASDDAGEDSPQRTLRVLTWSSTEKERAGWMERMQLLDRYVTAAELIALAGTHRAAKARTTRAWEEVKTGIRRADTAGVPKTAIAALASTSPPTVHQAVRSAPEAPIEVTDPSSDGYWSSLPPAQPVEDPEQRAEPATARPPAAAPRGPAANQPGTPRPAGAKGAKRNTGADRFAAAAAVIDTHTVHMPDGSTSEWSARHLGELAQLVATLRLGVGGAFYSRGELWLTAGALERLGLPTSIEWDRVGTHAERSAARRGAFERLNVEPFLTDAIEAGWQVGQGGQWEARTTLTHPELLPKGATIVVMPWLDIAGIPLLVASMDAEGIDTPADPSTLAARLQECADRIGIPYRVSPGNTFLDLIDATRRPRNPADPLNPASAAVAFNTPADLPAFKRPRGDDHGRYHPQIAQPISWWRAYDSLGDAEKAMGYVHAFDHRSHFLGAAGSTTFGIEGLEHRTGDDARWDGTERAAYYLISGFAWHDWTMFNPVESGGVPLGGDRWLVTSHTLHQLKLMDPGLPDGLGLTFEESWTWRAQSRYLDKAARQLSAARRDASPEVADTVKMIYAQGVGKLAETHGRQEYHLWRPDWRDMIYAAASTSIVRLLMHMQNHPQWETSSPYALAVATDAVFIASHEADPRAAWPGDPAKLESLSGGWKPIGSAPLQDWGPQFLPTLGAGKRRLFPYAQAVDALTEQGHQ